MAYGHIVFLQEHQAEEALKIYRKESITGLFAYLVQWHASGEHEVMCYSSCGSDDEIWFRESECAALADQ